MDAEEKTEAVFTAEEFAGATGGVWRGNKGCAGSLSCYTDTRQPGNGKMFLALAGEKFDGHDFLARAEASGAAALCIAASCEDRIPENSHLPVLLVEDTLLAYQALAHFHRARFADLPVVAVTGSVGKTSVKEMCRAILSEHYGSEQVLCTEGNTNNQIGVPRNLMRLSSRHRAAVIEMGTSSPGEIEPLSRMAEPRVALINSIAPCHLEKLGSFYGIAQEKSAVFCGLPPDGHAVIPAECPASDKLVENASKYTCTTFGTAASSAAVRSEFLKGNLDESSVALIFPDGTRKELHWHLTGEHQALNAAAAAAVGLACGVPQEVIVSGLEKTTLPGMRMARSEINGVVWINDAYNANPASMEAAIRQLATGGVEPGKLVLLLGDMLELGTFEEAKHKEVLQDALTLLQGARFVTVGPRFARAASSIGANVVTLCGSAEGAKRVLGRIAHPGDTVFLKGSRGMHLENAMPEAPEV